MAPALWTAECSAATHGTLSLRCVAQGLRLHVSECALHVHLLYLAEVSRLGPQLNSPAESTTVSRLPLPIAFFMSMPLLKFAVADDCHGVGSNSEGACGVDVRRFLFETSRSQ